MLKRENGNREEGMLLCIISRREYQMYTYNHLPITERSPTHLHIASLMMSNIFTWTYGWIFHRHNFSTNIFKKGPDTDLIKR